MNENELLTIREERSESAVVLALQGDLTRDGGESILGKYAWEKGVDGTRYLVLDLEGLDYIDSGGMAVLIRLTRSARKGGIHSFAHGVQDHYRKLFQMVGLTETLMVYPDRQAVMLRIEELE